MKNKTAFTPQDVNAHLAEIRVANDATVEAEAAAVEKDFNAWLLDNFELEQSQVAYLESLGYTFSEATGKSLALAFRERQKVSMEKGDKQLRSIKFVREGRTQNVTYVPDAAPTTEDELNYFIS